MDELSPYRFVELEDLRAYMNRPGVGEDAALVAAINASTAALELRTGGRKLRERLYLEPVVVACSSITGAAVVGTGFSALLAGTDVVAPGLKVGTRILSIQSNTGMTLDKTAATNTSTPVSMTCGRGGIWLDGDGSRFIVVPEFPVTTLYGAKYRDPRDATRTSLDVTNARIDAEAGIIELAADYTPSGVGNLLVECKAGYRKSTGQAFGHDSEWEWLARLQTRMCEVLFSDEKLHVGRMSDVSLSGQSVRLASMELPADIEEGLAHFRRVPL